MTRDVGDLVRRMRERQRAPTPPPIVPIVPVRRPSAWRLWLAIALGIVVVGLLVLSLAWIQERRRNQQVPEITPEQQRQLDQRRIDEF